MNITNMLITIISSSSVAAIFTIFFQNRHHKATLVEKWMCDFRDEVSSLIGTAEALRLHRVQGGNSMDLCHQLIRQKKKIHMLLNDNPDQVEIYGCINSLIQMADQNALANLYTQKETELVNKCRSLLRAEWHKISRFCSREIIVNTLIILNLVGWTAFIIIDQKLGKVVSEAVTSGTQTYGELYGPLSFWKLTTLRFSSIMTVIVSLMNLLKSK
jgi:hypothetical protein